MYLNTTAQAVQTSAPRELTAKTQQRLLQQQQQMEVSMNTRLEQLPAERASDFAAQLASYLWFSDVHAHAHAQHHHHCDLSRYAFTETRARGSFKKFCREVIGATQVSNSVIALSLLYINRMKKRCSTIQGHPGSEFRAFTVALMLANKFLDDNTYTNKTWSEVTHIPVREINIMEMEFLSALEFTLYVSLHQYYEWVCWLDQFVDVTNGNGHNDDGSVPDCSLTNQQQVAVDYCPSPISPITFNHVTPLQHHQQQAQIVPQLTVETTSPTGSIKKRSAEQAFDVMVTSPPKRTNSAAGSHPMYQVTTQSTPGPSSHLPQPQQPHHQPHQPQQRQARQPSLYRLAFIDNTHTLFVPPTMTSTPTMTYATSVSTAYAQPQYTLNMYANRMNYIPQHAAIPMTTLFPTTVV